MTATRPPAGVDLHGAALVVGVSAYQRIAPLPPARDADDVAAALRDPALCGYAGERVELRVDADATRAAVLDGLDRLAARAGPDASVFIYFSGHGGRVEDGPLADCYFMTVEASWRSPEELARTAISGRELSQRLRAIPAARVTVVLDCCRAGGLAEPKDAAPAPSGPALAPGLPPQALAALARGRGRAVLAASLADGFAYAATAGRRDSVFTHHLLEGLRGGAGGTGGVIRVCDLFDYVQRHVAAEVPQQRPVFKAELEENYALALYRGGEAPPLILPRADDRCAYDAFVSYRREPPDREWVEKALVPRLEALGLKLCLPHRDFRLGAPRVREMERAVEQSRYTIAVLTPRYLEGAFEDFQAVLAQHLGLDERAPRLIPLLREDCRPSLGIRTTEWLDVSDQALEDGTLLRLAQRLREPHREPLSS
jgi:hypothetical protein